MQRYFIAVGKEKTHIDKGFDTSFFAVDTETTGLDMWGEKCRPFAFSFTDSKGRNGYASCKVNPYTRQVILTNKVRRFVQKLLKNAKTLVFHNFAFDRHMLVESGFFFSPKVEIHDTLVRQHTLFPTDQKGLKWLGERYLEISKDDEKNLKESTKKGRAKAKKLVWNIGEALEQDYWLASPSICEEYAIKDTRRTMMLYLLQEEWFKQRPSLRKVYAREQKLMRVLASCEDTGVRVDTARMKTLRQYYKTEKTKAAKEAKKKLGLINQRSPPQMQNFWFKVCGLKPLEYSTQDKTKVYVDCVHCGGNGCIICQQTGRNPKCDSTFLQSVVKGKHKKATKSQKELAQTLLNGSAATTMLNYLEQYIKFSTPENGQRILHPNFKQCGPITARLGSERPNTQNVSSDEKERAASIDYRLRECFIPRKNHVLYIPDYSQIEVWVLVLLAGADKIVAELAAGGDAHQIVADMVYPDSYNKKAADQGKEKAPEARTAYEAEQMRLASGIRKKIKCLQFCMIYGGGDAKVASMLGISLNEAQKIKALYSKRFPEIPAFMDKMKSLGYKQGYVVSPYGREYPIPKEKSYVATNYLVQGSSADLLKDAMINVYELQETKYRGDMHLMLNIHDELMLDVDKKIHCQQTMDDVCKAMSSGYKFLNSPVPFPVGMKIAEERWSHYQEI